MNHKLINTAVKIRIARDKCFYKEAELSRDLARVLHNMTEEEYYEYQERVNR